MNPLAIVQARIGSTRLPRKMLLDLGGKPLIWWAWRAAVDAFGAENVVVAIPATPENDELAEVVDGFRRYDRSKIGNANVFRWDGPENDVLGRFHACAHTYRWHPDSVIVRVTPDDPFKVPERLRRVARGERHPVEMGGEAFTLAMLDRAYQRNRAHGDEKRMAYQAEHITYALFKCDAPPAPPGVWTIDTAEDLEAARELIAVPDTDLLTNAGALA